MKILLGNLRGVPFVQTVKRDAETMLKGGRGAKQAAKRMRENAGGLNALLTPLHHAEEATAEKLAAFKKKLDEAPVIFRNRAWEQNAGGPVEELPPSAPYSDRYLSGLRRRVNTILETHPETSGNVNRGQKVEIKLDGMIFSPSKEKTREILAKLREHGERLSKKGDGILVRAEGKLIRIHFLGPREKRGEYKKILDEWNIEKERSREGTPEAFDPGKWFNNFNPFDSF